VEDFVTSRIALITDSTSDLPLNIRQERQIYVAPLHITWGKDLLKDGIDITPREFYQRLEKDPILPTTSQPTPAEFATLYQKAIDETGADSALVLTISAELSGTYSSATQAAKMVDFPVRVVDTKSVSMGHAMNLILAADAIDGGASLDEAAALAESLVPQTHLVFTLNTLEYLHKGGRIGGAQRLIGTAFNIKPLLQLVDGKIEPRESIRTRKRALSRLVDVFEEIVNPEKPLHVGILHGNAAQEAAWLEQAICDRWQPAKLISTQVGAVIGVHTGPGAVGFAVVQ
jgi:DegV family protein with EDD domain